MFNATLVHPLRFIDFTLDAGTAVLIDPSTKWKRGTLTAHFTVPDHRKFGRMARTGTRDSFEIKPEEYRAT